MRTILGEEVTEEEWHLARPVRAGTTDFELTLARALYAEALRTVEGLMRPDANRNGHLIDLTLRIEPLLEQIALLELERHALVLTLRMVRKKAEMATAAPIEPNRLN